MLLKQLLRYARPWCGRRGDEACRCSGEGTGDSEGCEQQRERVYDLPLCGERVSKRRLVVWCRATVSKCTCLWRLGAVLVCQCGASYRKHASSAKRRRSHNSTSRDFRGAVYPFVQSETNLLRAALPPVRSVSIPHTAQLAAGQRGRRAGNDCAIACSAPRSPASWQHDQRRQQ